MPEITNIGLLGASSFVGKSLVNDVIKPGVKLKIFSRGTHQAHIVNQTAAEYVNINDHLINMDVSGPVTDNTAFEAVPYWICVAPVWVVPDYFSMFEKLGIRRIVLLSSTSVFTKRNAFSQEDRQLADRLKTSEESIVQWAESVGVEWIILRPTLVYEYGQDKNITAIANFIKRYHFFPVLGKASGLRQPVHANDVAEACYSVLQAVQVKNKAFNISGGETLSYYEMVARVFAAEKMQARVISVPEIMLGFLKPLIRLFPRAHSLIGMAERMNQDMIFSHDEATKDFGFSPRGFII